MLLAEAVESGSRYGPAIVQGLTTGAMAALPVVLTGGWMAVKALKAHVGLITALKSGVVQQTEASRAIQQELEAQTKVLRQVAEGKAHAALEEYLHTRLHDVINGQHAILLKVDVLGRKVDAALENGQPEKLMKHAEKV